MRFWFQMRSMSQNKIMVFSDSFITLEYMLISLRSIYLVRFLTLPGSRATYRQCHIVTKTRLFKYILKISPPKTENFQIKVLIFFHISAQNVDCGYSIEPPRRGGSNEYPQSMLLSRNNKNNVYPCKTQFYCLKVGFNGGSKLYRHVFAM